MEPVASGKQAMEFLKRYRYVVLVLMVGLFLMALPEEKGETLPAPSTVETAPSLQTQLEEILSQLQGAGKVKVLLSQSSGEETLYQTDRDTGNTDIKTETVIITEDDRSQTGLVRQVNPPSYLGAVVLCQGADNAAVKLSIVEAVSRATGLSTDKISVLKMK